MHACRHTYKQADMRASMQQTNRSYTAWRCEGLPASTSERPSLGGARPRAACLGSRRCQATPASPCWPWYGASPAVGGGAACTRLAGWQSSRDPARACANEATDQRIATQACMQATQACKQRKHACMLPKQARKAYLIDLRLVEHCRHKDLHLLSIAVPTGLEGDKVHGREEDAPENRHSVVCKQAAVS